MAGKGDEAERAAAVAQWLDGALGRLMQLTDEAIAVVAAAEPPADVAEAEKRGRAIGVLARTAKAVAALGGGAAQAGLALGRGGLCVFGRRPGQPARAAVSRGLGG